MEQLNKATLGFTLVVCLIALAIAQGLGLWAMSLPKSPAGPTIGAPLPNFGQAEVTNATFDDIDSFLTRQRACSLVVGISPSCPACKRMREVWDARHRAWQDSVGVNVGAMWVAEGESLAVAGFYQGYTLPGVARVRLLTTGVLDRRLGVYATPTIYLIDQHGRLRIGSIGFVLPPVDSARRICVGGG